MRTRECVWELKIDSARTRERLGEREREREMFVRASKSEREREIKWESQKEKVCESKGETSEGVRERESVCVCMHAHNYMHIHDCVYFLYYFWLFCFVCECVYCRRKLPHQKQTAYKVRVYGDCFCDLRWCTFDFWSLIWENVTYNIDSLVKGLLIMLNYWECHLWYFQPSERSIVEASYFYSQTA